MMKKIVAGAPKTVSSIGRRKILVGGSLGIGSVALGAATASVAARPNANATQWDLEADVVVIGSGATGLPAAIVAREAGCSVILVEAESHVGGHAIVSGGSVILGGGTTAQKKFGIVDSPDILFRDLTDWSVVESNGFPDYRYNDREIIRAFADNAARTCEWLIAHGVTFIDIAPDSLDGVSSGNSAPRGMHAASMQWPKAQTGKPLDAKYQAVVGTGAGLIGPLHAAATNAGVQILLEHRMTKIWRDQQGAGAVLGISVARISIFERAKAS
jgi:succinate dehydrogenase/fumarate reductase flavoprotein subunit